jgi:hypothetical protein
VSASEANAAHNALQLDKARTELAEMTRQCEIFKAIAHEMTLQAEAFASQLQLQEHQVGPTSAPTLTQWTPSLSGDQAYCDSWLAPHVEQGLTHVSRQAAGSSDIFLHVEPDDVCKEADDANHEGPNFYRFY